MLYFAACSGRSQSGDRAGTLAMPCLTLTGAARGVRAASVCAAAGVNDRGAARSASSASVEPASETFIHCLPEGRRSHPTPLQIWPQIPLLAQRDEPSTPAPMLPEGVDKVNPG